MIIGMPVYQGVDLLDVAGPHEIFKWMSIPVTVELVAEHAGEITTRDKFTFKAEKSFKDASQFDVLWVPGGAPEALKREMKAPSNYLKFLRTQANARYICSVCEGGVLLAASGLLDGYLMTTHWAFIPCLAKYKVKVAQGFPRFVLDRNRLTGGGISSGLDEAFKLVELLAGYEAAQDIQRTTQYYPCPPVASELEPATSCPLD
ncbi:MAG: DJ-1/PfpI family protein [Alphaproteobacteria bacterium]